MSEISTEVNDFKLLQKNLKTTDTPADKIQKHKKFAGEYHKIPKK